MLYHLYCFIIYLSGIIWSFSVSYNHFLVRGEQKQLSNRR